MRIGLWLSCVYIFAVYFRPQELYPELRQIPGLMDWLGGLALLGTTLDVLVGKRPSVRQPQVGLLVFFLLWAGFSVAAASHWLGGAWEAFRALSISAFVFFVVILHGSERNRLEAVRRTLIAALLLTVAFGLRAYYFGPRQAEFVLLQPVEADEPPEKEGARSLVSLLTEKLTGRGSAAVDSSMASVDEPSEIDREDRVVERRVVPRLRALGLLNDPNDFSQTLVAALPLLFLAWRPRRSISNFVLVVLPAAAMLWAVVLTRSRGGIVALVTLAWYALAQLTPSRWERILRWLAVGGLFAAMVLFFRLGAADESATGRLDAWAEGLQMLKYSPVWGVGFGAFADINGLVAHNSFVHCFGELGLVGYFAWLGSIIATFWYLERIRSGDAEGDDATQTVRWARVLELSLISFLAGALFLSRTYSVSLFLLIGLATALASLARLNTSHIDRLTLPMWQLGIRTAGLLALSIVLTYAVVILGR